MIAERNDPPPDRRTLVKRGLTWSVVYQAFSSAVSLASMLLLVRIVAPVDYGRAAAVGGALAFLNTFNAHIFMSHALQLPDGEEPPWQLHWSAGFYIHVALAVLGQAIALTLWLLPDYRTVAPLMHLGALGILADWPAQMDAVQLQRRLDFRRLQVLSAIGTAVRVATTIAFALAGAGACGIILGANVVGGVPFLVDLLCVERWRPRAGWWKTPDWREYRRPLSFGVQRIGGVMVGGVGGLLEAAVLPVTVGYQWMGLLTRSRALYSSTFGRLGSVLADTVYPFLPLVAPDRIAFRRQATVFLRAMLAVAVPSALFLAVEGPAVSRLLYGHKWIAMDPLIAPGALSGLGLAVFAAFSLVLVAAGRVGTTLRLDVVAAAVSTAALAAAWATGDSVVYGWSLAIVEIAVAIASGVSASSLLEPGWFASVVVPPILASGAAVAAVALVQPWTSLLPLAVHLSGVTLIFGGVVFVTFRGFFPHALRRVLEFAPGGQQLTHWLRLRPVVAEQSLTGVS